MAQQILPGSTRAAIAEKRANETLVRMISKKNAGELITRQDFLLEMNSRHGYDISRMSYIDTAIDMAIEKQISYGNIRFVSGGTYKVIER